MVLVPGVQPVQNRVHTVINQECAECAESAQTRLKSPMVGVPDDGKLPCSEGGKGCQNGINYEQKVRNQAGL